LGFEIFITMRLHDKVIIVTGSTSGIGRAIAERAVAEGAKVLIHGLDRPGGEKVVAALGGNTALQIDDLIDPASAPRTVAAAVSAFGRVDAVVNNAAIVPRSTLLSTSAEAFDRAMAINVRAPLLLIQAAFAQLKENHGCVLNIGSVNALSGEATLLDYSISKGALQTLSRNLANAHAMDGVRFNHFNVGWVLSEREYAMQVAEGQPADWPDRIPKAFAPSGRIMKPEEIAAAAVYWLGDESRPMNGAVVDLEQFCIHGRNPVKV
jgi:NAD(P)-dependent dehydrogenase (short-subunit alcohol dehydrogenase family)